MRTLGRALRALALAALLRRAAPRRARRRAAARAARARGVDHRRRALGQGRQARARASAKATTTTASASTPAKTADGKTIKTKTYTFGAMDVEGKLKTPQLLYFLNRVKLELDMSAPDKRSFMKELVKSADDKSL